MLCYNPCLKAKSLLLLEITTKKDSRVGEQFLLYGEVIFHPKKATSADRYHPNVGSAMPVSETFQEKSQIQILCESFWFLNVGVV